MTSLKTVGTGSSGNTYILRTSKECLILELGCKWNDVFKCLNYDINDVVGVLVTHSHYDHSKSIPNAVKYQIPVYSNSEVAEKFEKVNVLENKKRYKIGNFIVMPLLVNHNAMNFAYVISHEEIGKMIFCTDATSFPYKIKDVSNIIIESNYSDDIVIDKMCDNAEIKSHNENHMEITQTISAIKNNYSSKLNNIVLIHLSDALSNEQLFREKVFKEIGIIPIIANKGTEIEINKEQF